ncbi:MAG: hypothetical protein ACLTYN_03075 [Dysosmobacter welbionis]
MTCRRAPCWRFDAGAYHAGLSAEQILGQQKSFVTVTGKPTQARKLIDEPHIKWPLFAVCLVVAAVIILFYGTVVFGSFVKTWGYDYTLTLDQYTRACSRAGTAYGTPLSWV